MAASPNFMANGDINPSRLVSIDTTAGKEHMVIQATASTAIIGVAQEGSRRVPKSDDSADDRLAAKANEPIHVFGLGEECLVVAGAAVVQGNYLVSDANGKAIPVSGVGDKEIAGIALTSATGDGTKFRMLVKPFRYTEA